MNREEFTNGRIESLESQFLSLSNKVLILEILLSLTVLYLAFN